MAIMNYDYITVCGYSDYMCVKSVLSTKFQEANLCTIAVHIHKAAAETQHTHNTQKQSTLTTLMIYKRK